AGMACASAVRRSSRCHAPSMLNSGVDDPSAIIGSRPGNSSGLPPVAAGAWLVSRARAARPARMSAVATTGGAGGAGGTGVGLAAILLRPQHVDARVARRARVGDGPAQEVRGCRQRGLLLVVEGREDLEGGERGVGVEPSTVALVPGQPLGEELVERVLEAL